QLVLEVVRLEARELLGQEGRGEAAERRLDLVVDAQDARVVLGGALAVLPAVLEPRRRMRRHHDSRLRTADPGLPRPGRRRPRAVRVRPRRLAEAPDNALPVLGERVERTI